MVRIAVIVLLFSGIECGIVLAAPTTRPTLPELKLALAGRQQEILKQVEATPEYKAAIADAAKAKAEVKKLKDSDAASDDDKLKTLNAAGEANRHVQKLKDDAIAQDVICRDLAAQIADAAPHPEPKAAPPPPAPTFFSILEQLPKDARPDAGKWDEFSMPKARKFLTANAVGKQVSITGTVTNIQITRITGSNQDETIGWKVFLSIRPDGKAIDGAMTYVFPATDSDNGNWQGGAVGIDVSEEKAKAARSWKQNSIFTFVGTVKQLTGSSQYNGSGQFSVDLDQVVIKGMEAEPPPPAAPEIENHPIIHSGPTRVH